MYKLLFLSCLSFLLVGWSNPSQDLALTMTSDKSATPQVLPKEDQNAFITSQVRVALRTDPAFVENDITIKTDNGVVTLSGVVPDENAKASFESKAKSVEGVKSIKNDLTIKK